MSLFAAIIISSARISSTLRGEDENAASRNPSETNLNARSTLAGSDVHRNVINDSSVGNPRRVLVWRCILDCPNQNLDRVLTSLQRDDVQNVDATILSALCFFPPILPAFFEYFFPKCMMLFASLSTMLTSSFPNFLCS